MIWCVSLNPALDVTYHLGPELTLDTINIARGMDAQLGGKGNNVARVAQQLGSSVAVVTLLGGFVGFELDQRARNLGLSVLSVPVSGDSRVCLTLVSDTGTVTELRPPGPVVNPEVAHQLLKKLVANVLPDDWVTISGSLPQGLNLDTYAKWVAALRERVAGIAVDASGVALKLALAQEPTIATPNQDEYEALGWQGRPVKTQMVITRGRDGVSWHRPDGQVTTWLAPKVHVINPVGAGDTFLGTLVARLAKGDLLDEALPFAVAAPSASVERLGVATFDPDRLQQLRKEVRQQ